jgi:hypothetical protein
MDSLHASFRLDRAHSPWHIDLTITEEGGGYKEGANIRGIFARHGVFLNLALGAERPASFEAAGKDGTAYVFLRDRTMSSRSALELLRPPGSPPAPKQKSAPKAPNKRLQELQMERVKALEEQLKGQSERVEQGKEAMTSLFDTVRELAEAELDLAATRDAKIAAVEKLLKYLRDYEKVATNLYEAGAQSKQDVAHAKVARLKAEIELEKLKDAK